MLNHIQGKFQLIYLVWVKMVINKDDTNGQTLLTSPVLMVMIVMMTMMILMTKPCSHRQCSWGPVGEGEELAAKRSPEQQKNAKIATTKNARNAEVNCQWYDYRKGKENIRSTAVDKIIKTPPIWLRFVGGPGELSKILHISILVLQRSCSARRSFCAQEQTISATALLEMQLGPRFLNV